MNILKNIPLFKAVIIMTAVLGLSACNESQKPEDTKEIAEESNEAKFEDNKYKEKDAQFLVNAAEINLEEIELGQLAQEGSTLTDVKALANMMVKAHKKGLADLTALAAKKSITIPASPTDKAKKDYQKLTDKSGVNFDKEYCDMMVEGHKKAISAFEKASTDASDSEIREWAMATLPELRMHLEHAIKCQNVSKKM